MGYFSWNPGIGVAPGFGIADAMRLEAGGTRPLDAKRRGAATPTISGGRCS